MKIALFLILGFLAAAPSQARADQVTLTNGDRISGKLIAVTRETVQIESPSAGVIRIDRKSIEQFSTDNPVIVDLVSGERISGKILAGEGRTVRIISALLGERSIPMDSIDAVRTAQSKQSQDIQLAQIQGKGAAVPVAGGNQSGKPAETQKARQIGQKPEDEADIRKIFLRQSTVLLRPGQIEVEAAPFYARDQTVSPFLNAKLRQFRMPLAARIGLFSRAEGYLNAPVAYIHRELSFADSGITHREFGIGDISAGLNYEITQEKASRPDIIASISLEAPTGSKPDEDGLSIGSGNWATSFGLQFIKTVDPVALFGGIRYSHAFKARYYLNDDFHEVQPGEMAGYNFGFGFAVNENVSLSAQVTGSYQSGTQADGVRLFGSSSEPVYLRSALTYRCSRSTYIEPSLIMGLDDDTPDFAIGISLTYRLGK